MKQLTVLITVVALMFVGCGQSKRIDGKEYKTVGLIEMYAPPNVIGHDYDKNIKYEICWGNVIWGAIFSETIIMPIYFFGFSMYNPVCKMPEEKVTETAK